MPEIATTTNTETLRTLPGDDVRQIMWRIADRYDLQMLTQSVRQVARAHHVIDGQAREVLQRAVERGVFGVDVTDEAIQSQIFRDFHSAEIWLCSQM